MDRVLTVLKCAKMWGGPRLLRRLPHPQWGVVSREVRSLCRCHSTTKSPVDPLRIPLHKLGGIRRASSGDPQGILYSVTPAVVHSMYTTSKLDAGATNPPPPSRKETAKVQPVYYYYYV